MNSVFLRLASLLLLLAAPAATTVNAQDLGAIKSSMTKRIPAIDALKAKGALGENNQGYLEVRKPVDDAAAVAAAENKDRAAVYTALAAQTGTTSEKVGQARARQLAVASAAGVWVQSESGDWYRK
ncbi:MAG: DUF1318 domain-containing protein [Verrucomicrobiota bacterium]